MRLRIIAPFVAAMFVIPAIAVAQTAPTAGSTKEQSKPGMTKTNSTASQNPAKMDSGQKTYKAKKKYKKRYWKRDRADDNQGYRWGWSNDPRYTYTWDWWLPWNWFRR